MRKVSKRGWCKSASHQLFKDGVKNRVYNQQGVLTNLQSARKESRTYDVGLLEEQVLQMLREWKSEQQTFTSLLAQGALKGFIFRTCPRWVNCEGNKYVLMFLPI